MPQEPAFKHIYEHHILTARQLYDFAVSNIKGMHFGFATAGEHEHEARLPDDRMKSSKTVPGTHQLHSVIPISANTVEVRSCYHGYICGMQDYITSEKQVSSHF